MIKNTFHHGSTINTLLAIVRFNPVDVAFRDKRSTVYAFSFLKFSITFYLLFIFIEPVMIRCSILFYESISLSISTGYILIITGLLAFNLLFYFSSISIFFLFYKLTSFYVK